MKTAFNLDNDKIAAFAMSDPSIDHTLALSKRTDQVLSSLLYSSFIRKPQLLLLQGNKNRKKNIKWLLISE